jgi:hypothetical protein
MVNQVFISYRHESREHAQVVRRLGDILRQAKIPVVLDQFFLEENPGGPNLGWPKWCDDCANQSQCVLIVASEGWFAAYDKTAQPGQGLGSATEADLFRQALWDEMGNNARIRLAFLHDVATDKVPVRLRAWHQFRPFDADEQLEQLISWLVDSLGLQGIQPPAGSFWPETPTLDWPMADHTGARDAFANLLTRNAPWRFLPLRGPSETGKSHITRQMLADALQVPDLACGRFDFKGTTDMDAELRAFVQDLGVPMPPASPRLNERLAQIFDGLKRLARPALLVFDTYEAAGEAQDWVEKLLLPSLIRAIWLRVVIAGQRVPPAAGVVWTSVSRAPLQLIPPPPADWFDFAKQHRPSLTLEDVETACRLAANKSSLLAQLLGPAT